MRVVLFDDVTWQVQAGDRVGLCGPNGSGKTTLLRMLAGLDEPDSGVITHPADLTVGYLPQDGLIHAGHTLFAEAKTAFENLLSFKARCANSRPSWAMQAFRQRCTNGC